VRQDPLGKRALFEMPAVDIPGDEDGPEAVFNHTRPADGVTIECSRCGDTSHVPIADALMSIAKLTIWLPGPRFNRWMTCPSCDRRAWCRVSWL
jgi:hypothetical protein